MVTGAEVAGDRNRVAGAGVGPGQGPPAQLGVGGQPAGSIVSIDRGALPVPQLADVEVALDAVEPVMRSHPSRMSLAACMSRWPSTTRWPCWATRSSEERLEHRGLGLLDLQEQRVVSSCRPSAGSRPGADAADARPPSGRRPRAVPLQQLSTIGWQGAAVGLQMRADRALELVALCSAEAARRSGRPRRVADEPASPSTTSVSLQRPAGCPWLGPWPRFCRTASARSA